MKRDGIQHKNRSRAILLSGLLLVSIPAAQAEIKQVRICDDIGEWPPFTYFGRQEETGEKIKSEVRGFTVDLVKKALDEENLPFKIDLLPWKRCLNSVESGSHHMLLNATYSDERAGKYLFSTAHSNITPSYFYLDNSTKPPPSIASKADLKNYRVGGVHGYNYDYYGLSNSDIKNQGIYNYGTLVLQLKRGHISLFVENYEILAGFKLVGKDYLSHQIHSRAIPGMPATPVYMLFNKGADGSQLKNLIDKKIQEWHNTDILTALRQPYPFTAPN